MPKKKPSGFAGNTRENRAVAREQKRRKYRDLNKEKYGFEDDYFDKSVTNWLNNMSDEERDGVETYTGYKYEDINDYLRSGKYGSGEDTNIEEWVRNATAGLKKFNLQESVLVHRKSTDDLMASLGLRYRPSIETAEDFAKRVMHVIGSRVRDKGFVSTSTRTSTWSGPVYYDINVPAGARVGYVDSFSRNKGERELLL